MLVARDTPERGSIKQIFSTLPWVVSPNLQDPIPALFQISHIVVESLAKAKAAAAVATPLSPMKSPYIYRNWLRTTHGKPQRSN